MAVSAGIPSGPLSGVVALVVGLGCALPAAAAGSLAEEEDINQGLFYLAVGDEIRKRCDSITPRVFRAIGYMNSLKDEALARGYSRDEIETYINDKEEKRKIRGRSDAYIRAQGAEPNDGPSLCRLGRAEIARDSPIGQLLRER